MGMRLRSLLWLVAMAMFLLPSFVGPVAASDRSTPVASGGCHDAPPPPCPDNDTAKHAAGLCCPLMSCAMALLPPVETVDRSAPHARFGFGAARHLTGLSPHKDLPPPRV